jgi:hypothetical protein
LAGGLGVIQAGQHQGRRQAGSRIVGAGGLNVEGNPELGGRFGKHQGQLATAHDADG